ncbi:MAG: glycosyl hydrolase family 28 protein [Cyclobacteriaceae bacterium]|nr:glycosyl hydrolase family 28 protein [Cyclobacteriaceae bacterium]
MKHWNFSHVLGLLCAFAWGCQSPQPSTTYNIADYGAKGDSVTLNTQAIQKAIDACAAAGGGSVLFPPGKFLTGTIRLRSNIDYHFANGAMLVGSGDINHYNKPEGEHNIMLISLPQPAATTETLRVLIDATSVENVTLSGQGTIEGNGQRFWDADFQALERPVPWISFRQARNITIRDVTFQNAPSHVLRFAKSEGIVVDGIKIRNHPKSPNTDGIDIVDTRNVHIVNSFISTGDDAICLKTDVGGLVENVVVTNCIIESDDAAIKFGTGSASTTRYCSFTNNVIRKSRYGISLFMLEGGVFEGNRFSNLIMTGGSRHKHEYPIFIDVDKKRPTDAYGAIRNTSFTHLTIASSGKILINGRPEIPIENLHLENISFSVQQEADFSKATKPRGNKNFPKLESAIDRSPVAAHVTLGYIDGLSLSHFHFHYDSTSTRQDIDMVAVRKSRFVNNSGNDISRLK